jgi:hypothetical protein
MKSFYTLLTKSHPLYLLEHSYIHPILNQRLSKSYNHSNQFTISHTSNTILKNHDSLRSIAIVISLLTNCSIKRIHAKQSMASFNIQKNNLLGLKSIIDNYNFFNIIYKSFIPNNNRLIIKNGDLIIKDLINFKECDLLYDLIINNFNNIENQFGCRIAFQGQNKLIKLKIFNLLKTL